MSATDADTLGRCKWCGNMTDSAGCLNLTCASRPVTAPLDPMAEAVRVMREAADVRCSWHEWDNGVRVRFYDATGKALLDAAAALARPSEDGRRLDTTNLRERLADAYVLRESSNPTVAKLAELCRDAHDVLAAINAGAGQ
jgi:hypothetical protein